MPDHHEPLRIALLTHSVNPRGGVVHTLELASALQAAGHAVTIIATAMPAQRLFRDTACDVELIGVPDATGSTAEIVGTRINAYTRYLLERNLEESFDILHTQDGIGANALATVRERGRISGFVRTVHHVDRFTDPVVAAWQTRSLRAPTRILCVSRLWQQTLADDYCIRAHLVQNGVDLQRFSSRANEDDGVVASQYGLIPGSPLILSVGGVEERKNSIRLLDAFLRLRLRTPRAQLGIIGGASLLDHSAYRRRFEARLDASGLRVGRGGDVVLTGPVADAHIPALLRVATVVAYPSVCEGFGLVVLEALASGTPVVVSRIAPFTEYLGTNDVLWADPDDASSICDALYVGVGTARFSTPALCQHFSWQTSAQRHIELYREFLSSTASAPQPAYA
jgi:glycosyltransferase-like protein